jgi:hypothetical protein
VRPAGTGGLGPDEADRVADALGHRPLQHRRRDAGAGGPAALDEHGGAARPDERYMVVTTGGTDEFGRAVRSDGHG